MTHIIAYLRVSTVRQGQSGLGLDAQRATVEAFARSGNRVIVETFVEIESGKNNERPQLFAALARCKLLGCTIVVARLDRLARDLCFVASLLRDGVEFVACDAPYANRLTLGILAAVSEDEGRRISERVRAALVQAKARGTVLGGYRGFPISANAGAKGRATQRVAAQSRAEALKPILAELSQQGIVTTPAIAQALNAKNVTTPRGARWHAASVARMMHRV